MLNRKTLCCALLLIILSTKLLAQAGPDVPCADCEQLTSLTRNVKPTTGFWYNPEQSGSGFSIEIKNRTMFGAYYGYDDEGKPIWFTFLGQLQPSSKTGVMWELDSELSEFNGGNSLNSEYKPPALADSSHTIHIDFNHLNHASFNVDDGSIQNIVPLDYGVEHVAYFPGKTSLKTPDLEGFWVFSLRVNTEIHPINQYFISGFHPPFMVNLRSGHLEQFDDGTSTINFIVYELQPVPELGLVIGGIGCYTFLDVNNNLQGPICSFSAFVDEVRDYIMPMGGIGIDKLFGETEDGYTFKAFRYDYCDYDSRDITYVCEYDYSNIKQLEPSSKRTVPNADKSKIIQETEPSTKYGEIGGKAYEAFKSSIFDLKQKKAND